MTKFSGWYRHCHFTIYSDDHRHFSFYGMVWYGTVVIWSGRVYGSSFLSMSGYCFLYHVGVTRSFQEFCSLMWLLDVRNELALASRRYSKLKQNLSLVSSSSRLFVSAEKKYV